MSTLQESARQRILAVFSDNAVVRDKAVGDAPLRRREAVN
jgi:hypothetical protein